MKVIGIIARTDRKKALEVAKAAINFLAGKAEIVVEDALAKKLEIKTKKLEPNFMLAIGGDGTVLRTLQNYNKPLLGVNVGSVGFLTEIQPEKLSEALGKVLVGKYKIEKRIKLRIFLNNKRLPDATNELVLHTGKVAKICNFKVRIDKQELELKADGLIIATPTGSTSYALSVGSPVIDPKVNAFVLAPIAPFRYEVRPLVVAANSIIEVKLLRGKLWRLAIDGQYELKLKLKDTVKVNISEYRAEFIRIK